MSGATENAGGLRWCSKARSPQDRLRQALRTVDPWGQPPPRVVVEFSEEDHPKVPALGWCGSHAPAALVVTLVRAPWKHTGGTPEDALLTESGEVWHTVVHEIMHHIDPAWRDCIGLPWAEFHKHAHRPAFQRVLALAEARCYLAGLLRLASSPNHARGRTAPPLPSPPREDAEPTLPYPTPIGWWPDLLDATRVFAGVSLAEVFHIADRLDQGFPEAGPPAAGTIAAWPGSAVTWTVVHPGKADSWCSAGRGVTEYLPNRALAAMVAAQDAQGTPAAACTAS